MVMPDASFKNEHKVHNLAQRYALSAAEVPESAVPLSVLKRTEEELRTRGLLGRTVSSTVLPLWFLGETERNVFLWRNGLSVDDASRFEFWIDVPRLIEKQLTRAEGKPGSDSFFLPLWTTEDLGKFENDGVTAYCGVLSEIWELAGPHLHALSAAAREVVEGHVAQTPIVVLPLERQVEKTPE